jgi:peptidoglycan-associated lipoprotein
MRRSAFDSFPVRALCSAISLGVMLAGCARGQPDIPAARLGKNPDIDDRNRGKPGSGPPGSRQEFQTSNFDTIYFSSDSTELTPEGQATLTQQSRWLNLHQAHTVMVEGHADERGTREYNIALGAKRAAAVKAYLTSQGVAASRLRTMSYGKERPVVSCNDISCWSQNRRAQTVLSSTAVGRN